MSAQPAYQLQTQHQEETEVLYLLVPPTVAPSFAPTPYSLSERLALGWMQAQSSLRAVGERGLALYAAVLVTGVLGYSAYTIKSAAGIDVFETQHLESFMPVPGFNR